MQLSYHAVLDSCPVYGSEMLHAPDPTTLNQEAEPPVHRPDVEPGAAAATDQHCSWNGKTSVVFFDGVCGLCNRFVNFVLPRDTEGRLNFSTLQGSLAKRLVSESDRTNLKSVVFWNGRNCYRESTAVVRILWSLGGVWRAIASLLWCIPWPIRDIGYRLVSRFRYRIFKQVATCRILSQEEQSRFLD